MYSFCIGRAFSFAFLVSAQTYSLTQIVDGDLVKTSTSSDIYYNGLENLDRYIRWNFGGKMKI